MGRDWDDDYGETEDARTHASFLDFNNRKGKKDFSKVLLFGETVVDVAIKLHMWPRKSAPSGLFSQGLPPTALFRSQCKSCRRINRREKPEVAF